MGEEDWSSAGIREYIYKKIERIKYIYIEAGIPKNQPWKRLELLCEKFVNSKDEREKIKELIEEKGELPVLLKLERELDDRY